ncbi:Puromycin-sensitive aminopeptidase-like Protein [Tribolium castaneum]|uniref:Aminopeptidase n=1 Tax=Tribolium castaneum TaxID=7070 RepID=A0A139W8B2_TRICA|nr:PREDICTED: puromycin-sensitive aminopeptidase-like protein [Tribolium castaneum]KXZ75511.1 Puromycin-sensitive aminopeptidase-like Protein [Tribolium castaneum]|eukprot:XP_008200193.1 PREDICTED: puromycin-sensitive aminopeptidase-like protein [Tribolium castaneum]
MSFLVSFSSRFFLSPLRRVPPIPNLLNELPEVPLFRRRPSPSFRRAQRTRLVHSVAVSVEQPLRGAPCSDRSTRKRFCFLAKESAMPTGKPFERLPETVRPKHYVLELVPDLKALVFDGTVAVQIEVVKPTNEIVLNAIDLEIKETTLKGPNVLTPDSTNFSVEDETVTFNFAKPLTPGSYTLSMRFKGELNDKMKGLYRSKYQNQKGEERYAAVTQFEATDARRCFPCWDEPALKATFDITLTVPKDLVALSNMPVKQSKPQGDLIRYDFATTPIMSTYLVACVVGEYDYVEDKSTDGVQVRVYTPRGKKEQGLFALEVATKVLPYYKDYFNIAYPLPKIDLIAIADFSAGAMENWGLVTYRETCLLVDPQNTSAVQKQWIALVVGHELAHQWFGNLVTMEWWTHLWLNEGYASFVEYLCVDHLFPEYDIWTQFVNDTYIRALELDCLKNSHPIEVPVGHPSEIDEIFDDISYNKGASVIRMLHNYIGDEDFRKGMNLYLTRHQYKNTFTEDLWAALEEASNKPVGAVMSTWTKQMGFPVIKVTSRPDNNKGVVLTLAQSKYTADGSKAPDDFLWMIPVSIITSKQKNKPISTVLKTKEAEVVIPDVGPNDWIKVNPGTVGFYRTQYAPDLLAKFIPAIKDRSLPPLDRLGLLDDLFAMVQAGHTNTVEVLKLLEAFTDETDYTVWSSINNVLVKLNMLLSYTDCADDFKTYQKRILSKIYKRLGWNPKATERHLDTLLRGLVLGRLSWLDDDDTIAEAKKRFEGHVNSSQTLPADLRSACYKTVLRAGGEDVYNTLLKLYRSVDLHEEKDRISRALGAAKDPEILSRVLKFAISVR